LTDLRHPNLSDSAFQFQHFAYRAAPRLATQLGPPAHLLFGILGLDAQAAAGEFDWTTRPAVTTLAPLINNKTSAPSLGRYGVGSRANDEDE
jgi:hypothetical protein